jgi:hypothetical protein
MHLQVFGDLLASAYGYWKLFVKSLPSIEYLVGKAYRIE